MKPVKECIDGDERRVAPYAVAGISIKQIVAYESIFLKVYKNVREPLLQLEGGCMPIFASDTATSQAIDR